METKQLMDKLKKLEAENKQLKKQVKEQQVEIERLTQFIAGGK